MDDAVSNTIEHANMRKAYQPPMLILYGKIAALTASGSGTTQEMNANKGGCSPQSMQSICPLP